jgi:DNA-binding NarL/FixJ family response regulator
VTRVVVADDHVPTRAGIRTALEGGGFEVVGEAADAGTTVHLVARERPDICVIDVHMPGDGIAAAAEIRSLVPETRIVMLTASRNDADLFEAIKAGASGYLLKDLDPHELPAALQGMLNGEPALPGELVARLMDEFRRRSRRGWIPLVRRPGRELTRREWEVLELLRDEATTAEIAERLAISPTTVRRHVGSILHKLEVPDREAAVRLLEIEGG